MASKTVTIPAIGCDGCVRSITNELQALDGVSRVSGSPAEKRITVEWEAPANWDTILATLKEIEYPPEGY